MTASTQPNLRPLIITRALMRHWLLIFIVVYGVMRTADAVSRLATVQVATRLAGFIAVYSILGFIAISLIVRYARKGPVAE